MPRPTAFQCSAVIAVVATGAIFGFFYAWACSTMWGLDAADPAVAISAMQAMNASVRNPVFFPAFFLTPLALGVAAALAWRERQLVSARLLSGATLVYLIGGMMTTLLVNVPMNEALAEVTVAAQPAAAAQQWANYSEPWQAWNGFRTICSGVALLLASLALLSATNHRVRQRAEVFDLDLDSLT